MSVSLFEEIIKQIKAELRERVGGDKEYLYGIVALDSDEYFSTKKQKQMESLVSDGILNAIVDTDEVIELGTQVKIGEVIDTNTLILSDLESILFDNLLKCVAETTNESVDDISLLFTGDEFRLITELCQAIGDDYSPDYEVFGFIYHFEANDFDSGVVCSFNLKNIVTTILQTGKIG